MKKLYFCALVMLPCIANAQFSLSKKTPAAEKPVIEATKFNLASDKAPTNDKLTISGADKVYTQGELIDLWVEPISKEADSIKYAWTILPETKHVIWPDSTRLIFSAGNTSQEYTIILTASIVKQNQEQIDQNLVTSVVKLKIGGSSQPQPSDPGLSSDLANKSYSWVKYIDLSPEYSKQDLIKDAQALSVNFQSIAGQIESGQLTDPAEIFDTTRELNKNCGINESAWEPWFAELAKYLNESYDSGDLVTAQSYAMAWKAIVEALQNIK